MCHDCCSLGRAYWTATPTTAAAMSRGVPPGLEYLTKVDQLIVQQQIEILEGECFRTHRVWGLLIYALAAASSELIGTLQCCLCVSRWLWAYEFGQRKCITVINKKYISEHNKIAYSMQTSMNNCGNVNGTFDIDNVRLMFMKCEIPTWQDNFCAQSWTKIGKITKVSQIIWSMSQDPIYARKSTVHS